MTDVRNPWLLAGGIASALAAIAHLACIAGGTAWYRAMGAPPRLVRASEFGSWRPALITVAVAALLAVWSGYALSGAGVIRRLPLLRLALISVTAVYLLRGLVAIKPDLLGRPDLSASFLLWSSIHGAGDGAGPRGRPVARLEHIMTGDRR